MPMSPHLNQQARLNILRKYQETGRIHASVTLREGNKLDDRRVIFDIVEGPVVKIAASTSSSSATHESGITSGRLREQLTISRAKLGRPDRRGLQPGPDRLRRDEADRVLPRPRVPRRPRQPGAEVLRRPSPRDGHVLRLTKARGTRSAACRSAATRSSTEKKLLELHRPAREQLLRPQDDRGRPAAHPRPVRLYRPRRRRARGAPGAGAGQGRSSTSTTR